MPYDSVKSFEPVTLIGTVPMVLVTHPSLPVKTFQEFVAYGKKNPEALRCGIVPGSGNHMATESLKLAAAVPLMPVPYQSDAPMVVDLLGGHINCVVLISTQGIAYIREGRLNAIAATSEQRLAILPHVPTLQELGLKGFLAGSWNGLFAPSATPAPIRARLEAALRHATTDEPTRQRLAASGNDVVTESADAFGERIRKDRDLVRQLIRETGLKIE
jgi:tripartite-type tricarboxylate transporter receptor subunit TctC